jgi:hypothetical protein
MSNDGQLLKVRATKFFLHGMLDVIVMVGSWPIVSISVSTIMISNMLNMRILNKGREATLQAGH